MATDQKISGLASGGAGAEGRHAEVVLSRVNKSYGEGAGRVWALRDVSLRVPPGGMIALLGRSGSGKSTLLNLLGAVDRPTSGSIRIGSQELSALSEKDLALFRRRQLGFVFQAFHLVPSLRVFENVAVPLLLDGALTKTAQDEIGMLLERLGISGLARRYPDELSGGQQQRVAIARAVCHHPQMLLADEPTGNLDVQTGRDILDLLAQLPREMGVTVVMATHSDEASARCDGRIKLEDGRVIETSGPVVATGSGT